MEPSKRRLLAVATCAVLAGCAIPEATRWLARSPDFSSPQAAGRSFLAAVSCDNARTEYLCLGEELKARYGATFDVYLLARPRMRADLGLAADYAYTMEVVSSQELVQETTVWWGDGGRPRVGLVMQLQHYFDLYESNGRARGDFLPAPPGDYLSLHGRLLSMELPVNRALAADLQPDQIERLVLGSEWKIREILPPDEFPTP